MPLVAPVPRPTAASNRSPFALYLSALFSVLALVPLEARAEDACARKCVQRQTTCSTTCSGGDKCRQRCNDSADACFTRCQKTDDAREEAEQRRGEKACVGANGQLRKCTAAEAQQLREGMKQASKLMCRGKNGEQVVCADQAQQLDDARKFVPKNCTDTGCKADPSN